jgi:hypothetical protein
MYIINISNFFISAKFYLYIRVLITKQIYIWNVKYLKKMIFGEYSLKRELRIDCC